MLRHVLFGLCLILGVAISSAQKLKRSTLSNAGLSIKLPESKGSYTIQQSIGQGSVIGTTQTKGIELRQGFIQSPLTVSETIVAVSDLDALVHPNPFVSELNIKFNEEIDELVFISIYDMMGRLVFTEEQDPRQELTIDLKKLSSAVYVLRIASGDKQFKVNIIKK